MISNITQEDNLIPQSYYTVLLLKELGEVKFEESSAFDNLNLPIQIKKSLKDTKIQNQGSAIMALYAMLFVPKELIDTAQILLDGHHSRTEVANKIGVKYDTLRKAISDGRLKEPPSAQTITTKSSRSTLDAEAADGLGTACTRREERIAAAFGIGNGATIRFEPCLDVPKGGAPCALPALLANGLLHGAESLLGQVSG